MRQVRKQTTLMSNIPAVSGLAWAVCDGTHSHMRLSGNEGGQTRTSYAAVYPLELVNALADAFRTQF